MGQFKGRLSIENQEEKEYFKVTKDARMKIIMMQLDDLHKKKFGSVLDFKLADLESFEKTIKF